jgi:hypothetical protein
MIEFLEVILIYIHSHKNLEKTYIDLLNVKHHITQSENEYGNMTSFKKYTSIKNELKILSESINKTK